MIQPTTSPHDASPTAAAGAGPTNRIERGVWSEDEHAKFLEGLKMYPRGPWKDIALIVGTRTARQVQTHAQKYYEKVARHVRGLRKNRRNVVRFEHRLDEVSVDLFKLQIPTEHEVASAVAAAPSSMGECQPHFQQTCDLGCDSEQQDWVEHLGTDDQLDWVEHFLRDEAVRSPDGEAAALDDDVLTGVDDSFLSYLVQILGSDDTERCNTSV